MLFETLRQWARRQAKNLSRRRSKSQPIRNGFRPKLIPLECRATPAVMVATDVAPGGSPLIQVIDPQTETVQFEIMAFDPSFQGGVDVATTGDSDGDNYPDVIIAGAGPGGGPHVKLFNGKTGEQIDNFFAYEPTFRGGVNVALGDITGDNVEDFIFGTGVGGGPRVQVIDGATNEDFGAFFAYDSSFRGGVSVASADMNGDGADDIIVAAGPGGGPHVAMFDGNGFGSLGGFFAYESTFTGGITVDVGDTNGDGVMEIVTGPLSGGGSVIKIFATDGTELSATLAFPADYRGGIRIKVENTDGDAAYEITVLREGGDATTIRIRFLDDDGSFDDYDGVDDENDDDVEIGEDDVEDPVDEADVEIGEDDDEGPVDEGDETDEGPVDEGDETDEDPVVEDDETDDATNGEGDTEDTDGDGDEDPMDDGDDEVGDDPV